MVGYLSDSEHCTNCTVRTTEIEKAWYLLSVLLSIGRPARLAELAARCDLFCISPDLVQFLCSIPNSPLFLTDNLYVTTSNVAVSAFRKFESEASASSVPRITLRISGPKRLCNDVVRTYFRKRKGPRSDAFLFSPAKRRLFSISENELTTDEEGRVYLSLPHRIEDASTEAHVDTADSFIRNVDLLSGDMSIKEFDLCSSNKEREVSALLLDSDLKISNYGLNNTEYIDGENEIKMNIIVHREALRIVHTPECPHGFFEETIPNVVNPITVERTTACVSDLEAGPSIREIEIPGKEAETGEMELKNRTDLTFLPEVSNNSSVVPAVVQFSNPCGAAICRTNEVSGIEAGGNGREEQALVDSGTYLADGENLDPPIPQDTTAQMGEALQNELELISMVNIQDTMTSFPREVAAVKVDSQGVFLLAEVSAAQKQTTKSFTKLKTMCKDTLSPGFQVLLESLKHNTAASSPKQQGQHKRDQKFISMKQKIKQTRKRMTLTKENRADPTSLVPKNKLEPKALPNFEFFVIEEEEGSGGYGTVYRAQRKNDGKTFAIKCPHKNAHSHHVNNELQMLERFGGRNFVIKYEGSFKSGSSEYIVLEHVEHDRPEVLKKEIDIFQLQWYGYCMFRALANLHKQGIVHRDVKPGNFLFSRKLNKGYLIDFNLAMDLHQKYSNSSKSKTSNNYSFDHVPLPRTKSVPPMKGGKVVSSRSLIAVNQEATKNSKSAIELKNMKKRVDMVHLKVYPDMGTRNIFKSQGADGSGITSAKDATSTRTPSAERLREPLPCRGRKELINLLQETMESPNHDARTMPASQRKRVAATPGKMEKKLFYLTPMPLHFTGVPVSGSGSGSFKNKGDGKNKREGPCVGTKGFRAPEVLFRSPHQGCKVDIWSAGVTLLYLMIGRTPFVGDPEQNVKDIAKLRGCEDLWEVAKLHNRESSFPTELFDIQSLSRMELREWYEANTKRPDLIETIPRSLFDLVDKCLTVNPRLRISSEEALRHEFFAPCHKILKKQRLLRRGISLESGTDHHSRGQKSSDL